MDKQRVSRKQIEAPGNASLQAAQPEEERKLEVITGYLETFGAIAGRVLTEQVMQAYVDGLADLELRRIEKGLKKYLQHGERFPWPGELRSYCEEEI